MADIGAFPVPGCEPVRHFTWATGQRHRPGLQSMAGTGRLHGFESHAEQRLLLALDFLGAREVVSQPHRMRFESVPGPREHTPDFLAVTGEGTWLLDVRPSDRIAAPDRVKFAASAEAALACGWRYGVVSGWQRASMTALDTLSAQRRPLRDPLGLTGVLLSAVTGGPVRFADLVAGHLLPGGRPRVRDSPDLAPGPGYRPGRAVRGQFPGLARAPGAGGERRGPRAG